MKKEKKPFDPIVFLVYLGIGVFVLLILAPPILRFAVPKDTGGGVVLPEDTAAALICKSTETEGDYEYTTSIRTNYKNEEVNNVKITYTKKLLSPVTPEEEVPLAEGEQEEPTSSIEASILATIEEFQKYNGVTYNAKGDERILTISRQTFLDYSTETKLQEYKGKLEDQKFHYEQEQGMVCSVLS